MNSATKKNKKKNQETNEVERLTKLFEQQLKEIRDQHNAEIRKKVEEIKMKDEEIKMKDEEIKMKDEKIKMKVEEIKMKEEYLKIKYEIKSSSTHQDCEGLEDKKFQLLPNFEELALKNGEKESNLIAILRSKFYRPIAENEQALYKFVEALFVDALQILDYESEISIEIQKSLDGI
ncbi:hypothetical protein CYY_007463, partial [Polysphondylium violaceum]